MGRAYAILVALLAAAGLVVAIQPAYAASSEETAFHSRTNNERTSRGLRAVTLDAHLSDIARNHSQEMANRNELYHNDNLGNEVTGWEELDENVGTGMSVDDIHNAFMDSDVHRAGILGNYEKVGIGTVVRNGQIWVTEIFYRAKKSSSTTTTTRRTTTIRRRSVPPAAPRVSVRTAAATRPVPVPAPPKPAAATVSLPPLASGKLEKLLGDLQIAGEASLADDAAPARRTGEARLAAVLWDFVEAA